MADHLEHRFDLLPDVLREIASLIGIEAAIALAREHGGRRVYCPEHLPRGHKLVKLIGRQAAELLCQRYTHEHLSIPAARTYLRWYDARMWKARRKSNSWISRELGIGLQQVARLLKGFSAEDAFEAEEESHAKPCPYCRRKMPHPKGYVAHPTAQLDFGFPTG